MGLHVGASDYFIFFPTLKHYGMFHEIKPDGWKLNKSNKAHYDRQMLFGEKVVRAGYAFYFSVGIDQCIASTMDYMGHAR